MNLTEFTKEYEELVGGYHNTVRGYEAEQEELNQMGTDGTIALVEKGEREKTIKSKLDGIKIASTVEVRRLGETFKEQLKNDMKPKGEDVDDNIVKLLSSGIELDRDELNELAEQHKGNDTTLRLLRDYGKKRDVTVTYTETSDRIKQVDDFIERTISGISEPNGYMGKMTSEERFRKDWIDGFKTRLQD